VENAIVHGIAKRSGDERITIEAFDVNAVDYLLKPFDIERLEKSLQRVRTNLSNAGDGADTAAQKLDNMASATAADKPIPENLLVKTGENYSMIKTADIQWIEAVGNYVKLHCEDNHYLIRQTLAKLTERLNPATFARIHRSHIVNINNI
jgi:two-component system LytT family response regulator